MKILITIYKIMDFGGIINNQEGLVSGLRELGHEVATKCLEWVEKKNVKEDSDRGNEQSVMGMRYDQKAGWVWRNEDIFCYKGKENLKKWKEYASKFDLIIWQIPVPSASKKNEGNMDWLELYKIPVKQIAYVHDGNFLDGYPWLYEVKDHLTGVVGVHPCAYHSLKGLAISRAMAFSPQMNIEKRMNNNSWESRDGWLSLQTFKGWKRVPDLVEAVPWMNPDYRKTLAGKGIDYYYLTSTEKCKWPGRWDKAIEHGMEYRPHISNALRDKILPKRKCLIDPSWSKKYAKIGDHFNRVVIDGIISGAIPIARNLGISTNEDGEGEFFQADHNYLMIPWDSSRKEFAEVIDYACLGMNKNEYKKMIERGRELLPMFDYRVTAQTFIDLAMKKKAGIYKKIDIGRDSPTLSTKSKECINSFFSQGASE